MVSCLRHSSQSACWPCALLAQRSGGAANQAVAIGCRWLRLTITFEFLFFHYVMGHSCPQEKRFPHPQSILQIQKCTFNLQG
jgi:hypothetical protein